MRRYERLNNTIRLSERVRDTLATHYDGDDPDNVEIASAAWEAAPNINAFCSTILRDKRLIHSRGWAELAKMSVGFDFMPMFEDKAHVYHRHCENGILPLTFFPHLADSASIELPCSENATIFIFDDAKDFNRHLLSPICRISGTVAIASNEDRIPSITGTFSIYIVKDKIIIAKEG